MSTIRGELAGRRRVLRRSKAAAAFTYDVPEAGELIGLCRNAAYEAAKRGEIPTVRMGRLLKVPRALFDRMFGVAD